ncbi:MAG: amidohydrolase family protein [Myxococcota bacterium]|nr:amidohydrolase family protein [Myxococcota bacterium]
MLHFPILITASALATTHAFVGATLHPVDQSVIPDGTVIIRAGRITAVGPRGAIDVPPDATVHALNGRHVVPGLIDLHSHIGGGRLHEALGTTMPAVAAVDAIDPTHPSIQRAQAGGITSANIMPGSGKLMGGQTAYVALRDTAIIDEMLICGGPARGVPDRAPRRRAHICGGVKMAAGTNPQGSGSDPRSRMGAAFLQREALAEGTRRLAVWTRWESARPGRQAPPEPDLEADAMADIVSGKRTVHLHAHRADDIITGLRLREEFGIDLVLQHGSEGFKVADRIAAARVPVAINVLDTPGGKEETMERRLDNPALLHAAGVEIALITDDPVQDSRLLLRTGGLAARGGLPLDVALQALTLTPARIMGIDADTGSLTPGKEADLAVLSGPPFSTWTRVEQTWVDGAMVFDRSDPEQVRHATGGDAVDTERTR